MGAAPPRAALPRLCTTEKDKNQLQKRAERRGLYQKQLVLRHVKQERPVVKAPDGEGVTRCSPAAGLRDLERILQAEREIKESWVGDALRRAPRLPGQSR